MTPRIPLAAAAALLLAVTLAACGQTPDATTTDAATPPPAEQSEAPVVDEPSADPEPAAAPTCETLITPGHVDFMTGLGWTAKEEPFVVGSVTVEPGIYCAWADWTIASDNMQFFGWGEISDEDAATVQSELMAQGWERENEGGTVYVTIPKDFAMGTDEDGYGTTYAFRDGTVRYADTKQSLVLINWL